MGTRPDEVIAVLAVRPLHETNEELASRILAAADTADGAAGVQRLTADELLHERLVGAALARSVSDELLVEWGPIIDALVDWRSRKAAIGPTAQASGMAIDAWQRAWNEMRAAQERFLFLADTYVAEFAAPAEAGL